MSKCDDQSCGCNMSEYDRGYYTAYANMYRNSLEVEEELKANWGLTFNEMLGIPPEGLEPPQALDPRLIRWLSDKEVKKMATIPTTVHSSTIHLDIDELRMSLASYLSAKTGENIRPSQIGNLNHLGQCTITSITDKISVVVIGEN